MWYEENNWLNLFTGMLSIDTLFLAPSQHLPKTDFTPNPIICEQY